MQKLEVGFEREFNADLELPDVAERLSSAEGIAKQLKLIQEQVRTYENAKNDLNVIVDNICSQGLKKRKNENFAVCIFIQLFALLI